ncbi:MAG: IS3 family transposase [Gammaproteobacteria bacterium]|nr:IS3 family transposase [Gammaproteobacteria bacterium]MYF53667.1 IS3 family transposase [Gammaproteobacteria bacterium]MYK44025.1 IS3 family transposase [Gammaproteobacteria bacterium]
MIGSVHRQWDGILGYRRMLTRWRADHGEDLGACRVRRLMKAANLFGVPKKKTQSPKPVPVDTTLPDLVPRDFSAAAPNWVWVTDLTELKTGEGKLFLCVLKDLYDGTLVGWQTRARPTAELVVSTVEWALAKSGWQFGTRTIIHSDHGSQYTSTAYRQCLQQYGLRCSMGRVRTGADNASAESVFAQLKRELVHRCQFRTRTEATARINHYFMTIYNPWRQESRKLKLGN